MNLPPAQAPEQKARALIDAALVASGWSVQDRDTMALVEGRGVAVREFPLAKGHGFADYLLFVGYKAVGVLEAKKAGHTLVGVETQSRKYTEGFPPKLSAHVLPLPFSYESNGTDTRFTNRLDPEPRSRRVFAVHRPETLAEWLEAESLDAWVKSLHLEGGLFTAADDTRPASLRARLRTLPPVEKAFLYPNQVEAITNLEQSFKLDKPRALVQMATGSGKTLTAVTAIYRLIKFGGARRVLFLVDRANLGKQTLDAWEGYRTPDDHRKLPELYSAQLLQTNTIGASTKVVITTIQRMYSMLRGEPDLDPELEEGTAFRPTGVPGVAPMDVVYSPVIPPEFFDVVVVDECHRSIYSLWRQVLEYFDAFLVGLTATPAAHTYGFFNKNLVMEYGHERAVADGVNVQFDVYKIRTRITASGSTIEAGPETIVRRRSRLGDRWERVDEDIAYRGKDLDRSVVARDQIRTIVRAFKERLPTEIYPGRTEVPKTLVFAKDDQHAEDIVEIFREEFGRGNDFCQKITYKTTGKKPEDLITEFRTGFNPRVAVTVDMIATGTDIRPIEIVMFMRTVQSRVLFEQMKGRGVRVISRDELRAVTPDAQAKTHFVIVDCVEATESPLNETSPLDQQRSVPSKALIEHVAMGGIDPAMLASLAARLARLDRQLDGAARERVEIAGNGLRLGDLAGAIVRALDPDVQVVAARTDYKLGPDAEPDAKQLAKSTEKLLRSAVAPLVSSPALRHALVESKQDEGQLVDEISQDELLEDQSGYSAAAKDRAAAVTREFEAYLREHKDEINALHWFFAVPHRERLRFRDVKELALAIEAPPRRWSTEALWHAYEVLARDRVKGASAKRLTVDLVALVGYALQREGELRPWREIASERFAAWMAQQEQHGRRFSDEQRRWLEMMRDHMATSLEIEVEDFDSVPFVNAGGLGKAMSVFGGELGELVRELNEVVAA